MEFLSAPPVSQDLLDRAARIKLACFDVDGTLTDGRLYLDGEGVEAKSFHVLDGQGLVLLRRHGIEVALITARQGKVVEHRAGELGITAYQGVKNKLGQLHELCEARGITLEEVAFMGDDLPDLACLRSVGLAVVPANAHPWTAASAHWTTTLPGGLGAAREVCDLLLHAQGKVAAVIEGFAP
jgi:3-deoxy-D-manno-octulosonate 8-phosphate phosphatase (KDO 8-P phosphatase)